MTSSSITSFTEDQLIKYQETFAIFDTKGDNKILVSQIGDVMRALGQNPTEAELAKCCSSLDPKSRVGFDVFLPMLSTIVSKRDGGKNKYSVDEFIECLRHFDNDSSGYISSAELRQVLTGLGDKLSENEVEQVLVGMEDQEGKVNYDYFVREMLKEK